MYKNPQRSDQAKRLREELAKFGASVSHAQALEVTARLEGARTLHVAGARHNAGVRIADAARAQAQALMFESLGRFEGKLDALLEELKLLSVLDDAQEVDERFGAVFRVGNGPVVSPGFDHLRADAIPQAFDNLTARLQAVLVAQAKVQEQQVRSPLYEGPMVDWAVAENADSLPEHRRSARYVATVNRDGHQLYLDVAPAHEAPEDIKGKPQMTLFVEVNEGLPCVHISNDRYGDQVLTVFMTEDGLYLRPNANDLPIRTGMPNPELTPGLARIYEAETAPRPFMTHNHAFIVAKHAD
jgi:hypothetical protein